MKAAILAGGKSRRMGKDKSLLAIRGEALILHVARALRRIFPDTFVVANEPRSYEAMGFEVTPDSLPGNDALGGLHAAISRAGGSHVFVAGCDMPFLQPDLLSAMEELGEGWDVVIPVRDGYLEPLCALYGKACEDPIRRRIAAGQLKMIDFHQEVRVLRIEEDRWRAWDPEGLSFWNLNTPEEYEKIFSRISEEEKNGC